MLSTQLKLMKEARKLTTQQLSDLSGVPVGTINRILSGQTDNPSFQTVCDLVMAMDGSLDELVGIKDLPTEGAEKQARASKELFSTFQSAVGTTRDTAINPYFFPWTSITCTCFARSAESPAPPYRIPAPSNAANVSESASLP